MNSFKYKKRNKRYLGVTLAELLVAMSFVILVLSMMSATLLMTMRKSNSLFNGEYNTQMAMYAFSENMSQRIRESVAENMIVFPYAKGNYFSSATAVFVLPGNAYQRNVKVLPAAALNELYLPVNDQSETAPNTESTTINEDEELILKTGTNTLRFYVFDRDGTFNCDMFGDPEFDSKALSTNRMSGRIFEFVFYTPLQIYRQNRVMTEDYNTIFNFLKDHRESLYSHKILAENVCFFQVNFYRYPIVDIVATLRYGRGGNSSRAAIRGGAAASETELFDFTFMAIPREY